MRTIFALVILTLMIASGCASTGGPVDTTVCPPGFIMVVDADNVPAIPNRRNCQYFDGFRL